MEASVLYSFISYKKALRFFEKVHDHVLWLLRLDCQVNELVSFIFLVSFNSIILDSLVRYIPVWKIWTLKHLFRQYVKCRSLIIATLALKVLILYPWKELCFWIVCYMKLFILSWVIPSLQIVSSFSNLTIVFRLNYFRTIFIHDYLT